MPANRFEFTGLILLSGADSDGVEESLLAVLTPFTIEIQDIQRIRLRGRIIIGVLIGLDPAHANAIADDIEQFSQTSGLDVAVDFS